MITELLGFSPDADPTIPGVLTDCVATVPSLRGMKGAPTPFSTPLSALAATCQGSAVVAKLDLTTRFFAGTAGQLYEAAVSTWASVSRAATYTGGSTNRWRFAQFGNVSLAANGADTIQASVSSGPFSCIAGAPVATIVETVGNFVFGFNTSANPNGWQCAALNGYNNWTLSVNVQGASGLLTATPGPILAGRRFGLNIIAYKKNSMYLGTYVGAPNIWEFDQIPGTAGAMSQESVVNVGTPENPKHIFMGEDNFYVYDGSRPVSIGNNRVASFVFGQLLQSRYYACCAVHDKKNFRVYFYYPVADSSLPDHCVVYNYRTDKWGQDNRQIEMSCDYVTPGITYDSLGNLYSTYDSLPLVSYDSGFLSQTTTLPAVFDTTHTIKTLIGPSASSSLTTGDYGNDFQITTLRRVKPRYLAAPATAVLTNFFKMSEGDALTQDQQINIVNGKFDILRDARWHRCQIQMTGDWEAGAVAADFVQGSDE